MTSAAIIMYYMIPLLLLISSTTTKRHLLGFTRDELILKDSDYHSRILKTVSLSNDCETGEDLGGWTTDGPSKESGIILRGVSFSRRGEEGSVKVNTFK